MPMSEVLMLGRTPMLEPSLRMQWNPPPPTSPSFPQNLLRQTMQNSKSALGVVENLGLGNFGKVMRALGALGDDGSIMAEPVAASQVPPAATATVSMPTTSTVNPRTPAVIVVDPFGKAAIITLSTLSGAASAYHGYKRNASIGWAVVWGLMGSIFPVITPAVAVAQGFGQRERSR